MFVKENEKQSEIVSSEVTGRILVDLLHQASMLRIEPEQINPSAFVPGLYIKGRAKSIVDFEEPVFTIDDFENKQDIFAKDSQQEKYLDTVISLANFQIEAQNKKTTITPQDILNGKFVTLYNKNGRVIRTGFELSTISKLLSGKPSAVHVNCNIVISLFASIMLRRRDLQMRSLWSVPNPESYIREEFQKELIDRQVLETQLEPEILRIENFINQAPFHIYFTKITGRFMVIYRTCDWRVYEYYKMIEEKHELARKF